MAALRSGRRSCWNPGPPELRETKGFGRPRNTVGMIGSPWLSLRGARGPGGASAARGPGGASAAGRSGARGPGGVRSLHSRTNRTVRLAVGPD